MFYVKDSTSNTSHTAHSHQTQTCLDHPKVPERHPEATRTKANIDSLVVLQADTVDG